LGGKSVGGNLWAYFLKLKMLGRIFRGRKSLGVFFVGGNLWAEIFWAYFSWAEIFGRKSLGENVWAEIFGRKSLGGNLWAEILRQRYASSSTATRTKGLQVLAVSRS
jgi:hypothetical protein